MRTSLQLVSACFQVPVGIVSLVMAGRCLLSRGFLPFHAAASGRAWGAVDGRLQAVILALLRVSGLGFLVVGLQLTLVPVVGCLVPLPLPAVMSPALALVFCLGLAAINYRLHARTGARTPWQGSLMAAVAIAAGIVLSVAGRH